MDIHQDAISRMRAITISREYGSGGGEIAARLASRIGWELIDHEVVVRVAQEMGVSIEEVEARDERTEGLASRILTSMQAIEPAIFAGSQISAISDENSYREALNRVVEGAVLSGKVVIVGRGAQILLANWRDVLHVRIVAPTEARVIYAMRREGLDQASALARVQLKDKDRIRYLQAEHHQHPENAHLYDIVLNTAILDLDHAVDLIIMALEFKSSLLSKSVEELGPAAGMALYPKQPGNFRPPESITGSSK